MTPPPSAADLARRDFLLAGALGLLVASCRVMAQVRASDHLVERPEPDVWRPIVGALIVTILPFEHPAFPRGVTPSDIGSQMRTLFRLEDDPDLATLPKALALFDDTAVMPEPPAPFVDDERRDLATSRVPAAEIPRALDAAVSRERSQWQSFERRFGTARFVDHPLEVRRAYFALWSESAFLTRRRFYRGVKALVTISAYSTRPFWQAVGYEGPLLGRG
jgi:hypothetical protein